MNYRVILLFLTAGANIGLAFFVFYKNRSQKSNIYFSIVLFWIAVWSLLVGSFRLALSPEYLSAILSLYYLAAAYIVCAFYFFSMHFPHRVREFSLSHTSLILIATFFITLIILIFGTVSEIFPQGDGNHRVILNLPVYIAYSAYFLSIITAAYLRLYQSWRVSASYTRRLIRIVLVATLLAGLAGIFFDLLLPLMTYEYIWVGPTFTMIMVFIIVRYVFIKETP